MRSAALLSLFLLALPACEVVGASQDEEETSSFHDIYLYSDDGEDVFVGQYNVDTGQIIDAAIDHPAFQAGVLITTDSQSVILSGTESISADGFDLPLGEDLVAHAWLNDDGEPVEVGVVRIDELSSEDVALNTGTFCSHRSYCLKSGPLHNLVFWRCRKSYCRGGQSTSCWTVPNRC